MSKKYSYSTDEERYYGEYDSPEEAAMEAFASEEDLESCYVGENKTPHPEMCFDADDVIEEITSQEDFLGEWAEDWPECTEGQKEELTNLLRSVFVEWMEKHGLTPTFFTVQNIKTINREDLHKP